MKENQIRPKHLIDKYFKLCKKDINKFFKNNRLNIKCVACNSSSKKFKYIKDTFEYSTCIKCGTLFNNKRPLLKDFEDFYKSSESSHFWANEFLPKVAVKRSQKIFKPNTKRILQFYKRNKLKLPKNVIDVGAGQGLFLDELKKKLPKSNLIAIEPSKHFAEICKKKGYQTFEEIVEKIEISTKQKADLVISNEVIEHVFSPLNYLKKIKKLTKKGGIIVLTTLTIDGIDMIILDKKSSQILPPHHINFISIAGFEKLAKSANLKVINISTPGKMDIDILKNSYDLIDSKTSKIFLDFIFQNRFENKFQSFLQKNNISSHIWIYLKNE